MLALHWRHYVNRGPRKMMMGEKKRACEAKRACIKKRGRLVDLLDAGAVLRCTGEAAGSTTAGRAARESAGSTASSAVQLLHDGVGNRLELLLLLLVLLLRAFLRGVEP